MPRPAPVTTATFAALGRSPGCWPVTSTGERPSAAGTPVPTTLSVQRDGGDRPRGGQPRYSEQVLDGGEQGRMGIRTGWAAGTLGGEHQGEHVVRPPAVVLVPGDEQHPVAHRRR